MTAHMPNAVSPAADIPSPASYRILCFLIAGFALLWFATLNGRALIHPDEGRYAEIAREMALSGDFITPRLNGIKYFEKPPLQYWTTALAFKAFGEADWAARLWPALTGFLAVLLLGFTGSRLWGKRAGLSAAYVLLGCFWWISNGHFLTLDMGVSAFMTMTLCGLLLGQRAEASEQERRRWMWLAWAAMALAVLSKGLIGLVLPGAVLVLYTLWQRDWALWTRLELVRGTLLFFLISAPWFLLVSQHNPEFPHFFFIHEHWERFTSTEHRREGAWWYFLPILVLGMFPWTSLLPQAMARAMRGGEKGFHAERLLLVWAVFIFLFFSKSGSKLPSYILPIFPALALLAGRVITSVSTQQLARHAVSVVLVGLAVLGYAAYFIYLSQSPERSAEEILFAHWLSAAAAVIATSGAIAFWLARQGKLYGALLAWSLAGLIGGQVVMLGHDAAFQQLQSGKQLAQAVRPLLKADTPIYAVAYYDQTVSFYLKRTLRFVDFGDEFSFGMEQEADKQALSPATFEQRWRASEPAMALMADDRYREYQQSGLPMKLLYLDARRAFVINH